MSNLPKARPGATPPPSTAAARTRLPGAGAAACPAAMAMTVAVVAVIGLGTLPLLTSAATAPAPTPTPAISPGGSSRPVGPAARPGPAWIATSYGRSAAFLGIPGPEPSPAREGFTALGPDQTGVAFTNRLSDASAFENQIRLLGSGVALGDIDGDGWCDLYFARLEGPNQLYRNLGDWRFVDVTEAAGAGLACAGQFSTGCAFADVDGDGDLDLLVNGIGTGTRLFRNDGTGRFAEAADSGLNRALCATSLALADADGDGDLDLYVANYRTTTIRSTGLQVLNVNGRRVLRPEDRDHYEITPQGLILEHGEPDAFYLNDGAGHFTAVPWTGGVFRDEQGQALPKPPRDWGLSVAFRDLNGDGRPDLYVCNDFWSPDRVWINESAGGRPAFRALPWSALRTTSTFSMGVDVADLNRDGFDDLLVLDMLSRDHPRRQRQRSMIGQSFGDQERLEDRPQIEHNTLLLNRGDGTFAEISQLAGLHASEWSWGVAFLDVDLDGYEDVLITTGHAFDTQDVDADARIAALGPKAGGRPGESLRYFPPLHTPNAAFRNRGDLTFEECGARWGFDQAGVSHGIALADLDHDGDLDVVVNHLNAPAGLYRNNATAPRVAIRLRGRAPNTQAIGARLRLDGGPVRQEQALQAGGRYLSGDWPMRTFAARTGTRRSDAASGTGFQLEVQWPGGQRTVVTNLAANRLHEITEPTTTAGTAASTATSATAPIPTSRPTPAVGTNGAGVPGTAWFEPVPEADFRHRHTEAAFDDFAREPLLSRRLSRLGPGVTWADLDGDGREDLLVGTGRDGAFGILRNEDGRRFQSLQGGDVLGRAPDDLIGSLVLRSGPRLTLLLAQSSVEAPPGGPALPWVHRFEVDGGNLTARPALPGPAGTTFSSPGPMAAADVDGDGQLDLFVGGRVRPGRFPEPAASRLFTAVATRAELAREWPDLGLVTAATFSDLTGDGRPDLLVASDWGPLRLWTNAAGRLEPWDPPVVLPPAHPGPATALQGPKRVPLSQLTGWWNGVASGDFDNDGRLDFIAANWGRNTPWQEGFTSGWRLYYADFAGRGAVEPIEAFTDEAHGRVVPARDLDTLTQVLPWIRERHPTAEAFGQARLEDLFGDRLARARLLTAAWPESTLFLNRGDHLEARPLPIEAQFAPAFGVCIGDADGDGHEDVFLSQNFFGMTAGLGRHDAGRGLWLRGNGRGDFAPVPGPESGILIHGEQRGAALADFDADGRVDLAVAQNNADTRLFRNRSARPGLRVRLVGPPGNEAGIGAVLRWTTPPGSPAAPARELHAGGGYGSQDSAVTVLAPPPGSAPGRLSIRWPGGSLSTVDVPEGAREISVSPAGLATSPGNPARR